MNRHTLNRMTTRASTRYRTMLAVLAAGVLLLSACGGDDDADDAANAESTGTEGDAATSNATSAAPENVATDPDGTLRLLTTAVPTELDPHRETSGGARTYWFQVYDRLTTLDQHLRPQPMLATSWKAAKDGLSLTMQLRRGVTFHDGTPFNADAAVASVERAKTLDGSMVATDLEPVTKVEAIDEFTIRFVLANPMPELPATLSGPAGALISPKAIADPKRDLLTDPGDAGSGPYLVDEFVPSERASYVRAPGENWDREAGKLARIEIQLTPDDRTRFSALEASEADAIFIQPVFGDQVEEAIGLGDTEEFDHIATPGAALLALLLKTDVAPMNDEAVRQAVIQAIDRDAIADGYMRGTCERSDQLAPEGFDGHVDDFQDPYPYDPDAAQQLLADAGKEGTDLDLYVHAGRAQIPEIMKEQLSAVGINATVTPLAAIEVYTTWIEGGAPTWFYQLTPETHFLSTITSGVFGPTGVGGEPGATITDLLDTARTRPPGPKLTSLYEDISREIADEAHFVPLCHPQTHYVVASDVVGFETAPSAYLNVTVDLRYVGRAQQ